MGKWDELLKQYEALGIENIIPVAHVRVRTDIAVLLDEHGNFCGAIATGGERHSIPCTIGSESRTSGVAPHPIHDNMSYLSGDVPKYAAKHSAYMEQLKEYAEKSDDMLAKSVYRYMQKGTFPLDIECITAHLDMPVSQLMVIFIMRNHPDTISPEWRDYYLSTLPQNGICGITGELDYIPPKYPKGIRNASDQAKLFFSAERSFNSMPAIAPGYIASQKIIHTLQVMIYEGDSWACEILKDNPDIIGEKWRKRVENFLHQKSRLEHE